MNQYETVVVYDGSLPEETIAQEQKKVEELFSSKGSLIKNDIWGKKNLAYSINGKKTGFYSFFVFEFDGNATEMVNDYFRFNENVLRTLTVVATNDPITPQKVETSAEGDK